MDEVTLIDWAPVVASVMGVLVAALVAVMPFVRRPKVRIEEDRDRANSRVELSGMGGLPHIRLLVTNSNWGRAAQGTRVLVEGYTVVGSHMPALTTLGHPSLDWPSTGEAAGSGAVTVFPGGTRPITLGYFIRVRRDDKGNLLRPTVFDDHGRSISGLPHFARASDYRDDDAEAWYFKLALAWGLDINDDRDKLRPYDDGYVVRLLVGAEDGKARRFDVHLDWNGDPNQSPEQVLKSALDRLAVE